MKILNPIRIIAHGEYPHPEFPVELRVALVESVQSHMRAYGLVDIEVAISMARDAK